LFDSGADPYSHWGPYGSAIEAAWAEGHEDIIRRLSAAGFRGKLRMGPFGNGYQRARVKAIKLLQFIIDGDGPMARFIEPDG